jgi:hypothetical protein
MVNLEAKKALCRKLNINYADIANNDLFSEEDIQDFVNQGAMQAWDFDFWDFAEHSKTATLDSVDVANGYVKYPTSILPSSIYYLSIDGKEYDKKNFTSFKKYFENQPTATDKFWSEFKRMIFFNGNACSEGDVIDIYGRIGFETLVDDNDLLPFSPDTDNDENGGNQACILLAYAEALGSDKKKNPSQAKVEYDKAIEILARLSGVLKQGRASEQIKNRPMFDVPDMFTQRSGQQSSGIGTFSI